MAENDTQTSSSQQPETRLGDAVPMSEMDKAAQKQEATESAFSLPLPAKEIQSPTPSDSAAAGAAKGKAKEDAVDKQREEDSLSIGPSDPQPGSQDPLVCTITLLLPTGARHPYKIDEKYLAKRSVEVPDVTESGRKDPFSISVYKLKELILREWREEWEGKPASPSSIRLIFFGKLLDDKEQLKKYQFSADSPNIVHMSVRPADMMEEDEAAKGKTSSRDGRSRDGGSGCCVIL
ncbi:ubiquitin-related domain-containing protein [Lasiosphaeris hirsuta]|uniref:Ubiquitin-related domain-containing protein n=1 Tax=Lasiosphaeris hirsuta TaxID=260670 RepID=A0AA40AFB0_9PEZI|nr:ubiquitin-related domain-containing protein [Lasiosphaeris hirsuta]